MGLDKYIGTWINKAGNKLEIKAKDKKSLNVSFFKKGNVPAIREYYNNLDSIDMHAELDYYESSIEVELWEKGKGFHLCLTYDFIDFKIDPGYYLASGISRYEEDAFLDKYYHLFEPLDYYKKIEK